MHITFLMKLTTVMNNTGVHNNRKQNHSVQWLCEMVWSTVQFLVDKCHISESTSTHLAPLLSIWAQQPKTELTKHMNTSFIPRNAPLWADTIGIITEGRHGESLYGYHRLCWTSPIERQLQSPKLSVFINAKYTHTHSLALFLYSPEIQMWF